MPIDLTGYWNILKELMGRCVITLDTPLNYTFTWFEPEVSINMKCVTIGFVLTVIFFVYFVSSWIGWR